MLDEEQHRAAVAAEVGALKRRLYLLGVDEAELPEALDEVVRVLLTNRPASTVPISFSAFCFGVAAGVVGRRRRGHGTRRHIESALTTDAATQHPGEPTANDVNVEAALDELPFRLRVVLVAVEMQRMSVAEVANVLGLPSTAGTLIEARLERARVTFASALHEVERTRRLAGTR